MRKRIMRAATGAAWVLLAGLTSCNQSPISPKLCTQVGCEDGVVVRLVGDIPESLTLSVSGPGMEARTFELDCLIYPCKDVDVAFLPGETPSEIVVSISSGERQYTKTFRPQYEEFWPNGSGCPSPCLVARVEIVL
ncbi:MAG: hypothetical protein ACI80V_000704 [Rhodothermales bacterium]|jgi:hypothetical protein